MDAKTKLDFDTPKKRDDLTGVTVGDGASLRFEYRVLPEGTGCLRLDSDDIPAAVLTSLLELAKAKEEATNGA